MARRAEAANISCDAGAAWAYAVSGRRGEAIRILEALQRLAAERYVDSYQIALINAGLGDKERAFEWLEKAYAEHSETLIRLKVEVTFGPELRSDPGYDRLMRRVGFPAS